LFIAPLLTVLSIYSVIATNMSGALGVCKARSLSDAITLISFGAPRVAQMIIRFHLAPND